MPCRARSIAAAMRSGSGSAGTCSSSRMTLSSSPVASTGIGTPNRPDLVLAVRATGVDVGLGRRQRVRDSVQVLGLGQIPRVGEVGVYLCKLVRVGFDVDWQHG